ncbi:MAG TPA: extracellular solute-binding protein [Candidatus Binatia bacterium]|jgi:iron(III) transport system substrate-binding protein
MRRLDSVRFLLVLSTFIVPLPSFLDLTALSAAVGADLPAAIAEGAKKEREVVVYGATPTRAMRPIMRQFEKNYGIKVNNWRGDAEEIVARVESQAKNGKILFDVVLGHEAVMATLERKGRLEPFELPAAQRFAKHFLHPEHKITPWAALPIGINFNTDRLTPKQAPKSWEDLHDPKWKKKFAMPHPGQHATMLQFLLNLEKLLGPKWLAVVEGWARQKPQLTGGFPEEIPLLTSGQAPLGIGTIKDKFQFAAPIDYVRMNRYLASLSFVAVAHGAPHPNAARLFADFFVKPEPQEIFAKLGEYVLHPDVEGRFRNDVTDDQIVAMRPLTAAEKETWKKKFGEMFKGQ